jgi:hypothetical protein
MNGVSELDQTIWAVVGATMCFEVPQTYAEAEHTQSQADKHWPKESFVITTAEAAARIKFNDADKDSETV